MMMTVVDKRTKSKNNTIDDCGGLGEDLRKLVTTIDNFSIKIIKY